LRCRCAPHKALKDKTNGFCELKLGRKKRRHGLRITPKSRPYLAFSGQATSLRDAALECNPLLAQRHLTQRIAVAAKHQSIWRSGTIPKSRLFPVNTISSRFSPAVPVPINQVTGYTWPRRRRRARSASR
jgi:hypothetical protein